MIIFLSGQDTYRSTQRLKVLRQAFCDKFDQTGMNVEVLYGDEIKLEDFRKAVFSLGLLSSHRFVIIKNLLSEKRPADFYEELATEIKAHQVPAEVILVFWEGSNLAGKKQGNKLYNLLKKTDKVEEFEFLSPVKLRNWLVTTVKSRGGKIAQEAVDYLIVNLGTDLWQLSSEIEKLIHYKKDELILKKDVAEFVPQVLNDNIFNFTDALANKNVKQASGLLADQLDSGANAFYLLTMLIRQFKILLQMKQGVERGQSSDQLQQELKIHPFVIKKSLAQVRKFDLLELKKIYHQLLKIDTQLKTTSLDPRVIFQLFIVEVCK